jgi:hypothetical protein
VVYNGAVEEKEKKEKAKLYTTTAYVTTRITKSALRRFMPELGSVERAIGVADSATCVAERMAEMAERMVRVADSATCVAERTPEWQSE